jgi:rhamnose utilization protein RhaD (predicted bifunctional aldolase and dehydrogenase)/NAD(P)-dependent dehydrogenase (short-subunit alcohol dehydrogenase family)
MQNRWDVHEARQYADDDLQLRVYSSRLLGQEPDLVLHGGGNTSVKVTVTNLFGDEEELLYVKGSGWDLATIEAAGFAPVKLAVLKRMATLPQLSDSEMVKLQRAAMTNPSAPNPSVEAILHAIIPVKYVDHTHADAVVTISNTKEGEARIRALYGQRVLIVPYVMPGFILARAIYDMTQTIDWSRLEGLILLNHGVFTFGDTARSSYERMIQLVTEAENYLLKHNAVVQSPPSVTARENLLALAQLRRTIAKTQGVAMIATLDTSPAALQFANLPQVADLATRGPLTPDHVIRTKRVPVVISGEEMEVAVNDYIQSYHDYFARHTNGLMIPLNPSPCWAVWPGHGLVSFGATVKEANIVSDIKDHTIRAIQQAEQLGGWQALPEKDLFEMEYWELEQAKLRTTSTVPTFQGKVALVTGAASGIGRVCVETLHSQGAAVMALDIDAKVTTLFKSPTILGQRCDVTDRSQLQQAVALAVRQFGGVDIIISNAGIFPPSETIAETKPATWEKSLAVNLSSHQSLLQVSIPYLQLGIDPAVVIIGSKNVPAPGPGVSAYSVAKAGLTQLARVAALELAHLGIRVNVIHPNAVFDTAIWTPEVLEKRATHYGMTVAAYKTNNLLKVEVTSKDVAALACMMAGPVFAKTTGAQVAIDGGNERVI